MTTYISRDYSPATVSYTSNKVYTPFLYELSLFLYRVMGYSVVGHTGFNLDTPITSLSVSAASNTTPIRITTSTGHGLSSGQAVLIASVGGNTNANGTYVITVDGYNTFKLNGSFGNGAYTSGGTVSAGFLYTSGLVSDGYGAGINFGAGAFYEVSIPSFKRTVSAGDIGKMLVLKSRAFPTKNCGSFKITGINAGSNRYVIDYRSTENPPVEATNSIDWWLYEIENTVSGHISNFAHASFNISAASNTSPIQITSAAHTFITGQKVSIASVGGNTNANGTWTVTVINSTIFTLDGSIGNGAYTSGGTATFYGYNGDGYSINTRILLQSPHTSAWQVRLAVEPTSSNLPLVSVAVGYNGNSNGDFLVGGISTHIPQYMDINPVISTGYLNLIPGGGHATTASRMSILADGYGQSVTVYTRTTGATNNGFITFGIADNEPSPTPSNGNRIFCYAGAPITDFGTIILRTGATLNLGVANKNGGPELCALTGWANLDGTSATSPLLSANAGDCPFTTTTEILPIEIWSGINCDIGLSGAISVPFFFNQRFMGTAPRLRNGRTNFGNFTISTENTSAFTVSNATNVSPIQITTSAPHSLTTGQTVTISGVTGNTAANGTFTVTTVDGSNFTLDSSAGNGAYVSGGTGNGCPRWLHLQNGIYLQWNGPAGLTA